jgi:hypothetical protein
MNDQAMHTQAGPARFLNDAMDARSRGRVCHPKSTAGARGRAVVNGTGDLLAAMVLP